MRPFVIFVLIAAASCASPRPHSAAWAEPGSDTAKEPPAPPKESWNCQQVLPNFEVIPTTPPQPIPGYEDYSKSRRFVTRLILMLRRIHGEHPSARLMFRSALAEVGRQFPELLLEENERGHLTARIGSKARTLDVPSIDRLWKLNYALLGVLDLVNSHYETQRTAPELAGIGIAAARGIAMALDPRSRLHLPYEWVPSSTVAPSGSNAASVPVEFGRWVCSDRALFVLPLPDAL